MSRVRVKTSVDDDEEARMMALFPKVSAAEKARFRELHDDENLVRRKAIEYRNADDKYRKLTDDYDVCVYYLTEKHRKAINGNITATGEGIDGLLPLVVSDRPKVLSFGSMVGKGIQRHAHWFTNVFSNMLPPTLTLYEIEGDFIIPRDEKSIGEVKCMLTDFGVPSTLTDSAGDCINEGIGLKSLYALVATGLSWYTTSKEVSVKGLKPNKFSAAGLSRSPPPVSLSWSPLPEGPRKVVSEAYP